ncbi:alpha-galactosidase [Vallitalea guaymasensis]|uniref:alpha-galactosidase n=1 Tax=Vallitalea guaymasensis TaxID=1185412 RepID=A0A8J8SEN2_9FIRM|nr:alpha-galactosidase [Vallitalea guaymasensis]QUH31721.1 alpha-galactosidase [Vallitalea guaymasensis]
MIYVNNNNEFHLTTSNTSYIIKVLESNHLSHLYYGRKIRNRDDFSNLYHNYVTPVGNETNYSKKHEHYSLNTTTLELSTYGKSDYREPSLHIEFSDNSRVSDFLFHSYKIYEGKKDIEGLPHTFQNEDTVTSLEIKLYDQVMDVYVLLQYSVFYDRDVITRSIKIINGESGRIKIVKAMSFNIDFDNCDYDLITLEGKWIREKHIQKQRLNKGVYYINSKKFTSSSDLNPFMCLSEADTTEDNGSCYGFSLLYSGNHQGLSEVSPHNQTRVQMGINPFDFSWLLDKKEEFQTPEVIMTYSKNGIGGMSRNFHDVINHNLIPVRWQFRKRPLLANSWEAAYFDFNEKKLLRLAKTAKELGMELFVLDDGWFKGRNDDTTSLGDWVEDRKKLPNGLEGLSNKINEMGLGFGLWVEPEMISQESDLYKRHPSWAIKLENREPSLGRNQLMLDMANPNVINYLYKQLSSVFRRGKVKYVKWDMNRCVTDVYSSYLPKHRQKELAHRYVLGLYNLLNRLKTDFEDILFESCASGGNRYDLGMLYYMPQTWASDNTDPGERMNIQYGSSLIYPLSTLGAHVGSNPSHQVLRQNSIESRFNVACFGLLGYELNLNNLSNFEKKAIKKQVEFYKKHRKLLQYGTFYRIKSPFETNYAIWMVVSKDKEEAIVGYYQKLQESNKSLETIKLKGLEEQYMYHLESRAQFMNIERFGELINDYVPFNVKTNGVRGIIHKTISDNYMYKNDVQKVNEYGDSLMYAGLKPLQQFNGAGFGDQVRYIGDFGSRIYYLKKVEVMEE